MLALLAKFGPMIFSLLPHVMDAVKVVQVLNGPTAGNGDQKLTAALSLLNAVVPQLEEAFGASASIRTIIGYVVSIVYEVLKMEGKLSDPVAVNSPIMAAANAMAIQSVAQPAFPEATGS